MANDQLPAIFNNTKIAPEFAHLNIDEENDVLGEGLAPKYGVVSIRGKVFRIKWNGEETPVVNENDEPVQSIETIIIAGSPVIAKQWFEGGYEEGSNKSPSCWSLDGKVPADGVPEQQHTDCRLCPMNQYGSRISDSGGKMKACSDTRRLAVVPAPRQTPAGLESPDVMWNEAFGGPMLFRVPASALRDLDQYGKMLKSRGFTYFAVATRIGFNVDDAYPHPTFRAIRPLTSEEAKAVMELKDLEITSRILNDVTAESTVAAKAEEAEQPLFEEPEAVALIDGQPFPKGATVPAPKPATRPAAPAARPSNVVQMATPKAAPATAARPPAAAPKAATAAAPRPAAATQKPATASAARPAAATPKAPPKVAPKAAPAPEPAAEETSLDEDLEGLLAGMDLATDAGE